MQVLDQFEGLQLGPAAPGQADPSSDPAYLPRPAGPEAEPAARPPPPFHKGNCDPRFIRLTTNAVPAQQVHKICSPETAAALLSERGGAHHPQTSASEVCCHVYNLDYLCGST